MRDWFNYQSSRIKDLTDNLRSKMDETQWLIFGYEDMG